MNSTKSLVLLVSAILFPLSVSAAEVPANLGLGLGQLVKTHQKSQTQFHDLVSSMKSAQVDAVGRVTVQIHLDGSQPIDDVAKQLSDLGLEVRTINKHWRNGVIAARLPIAQASAVATMPGVRSVMLAPRPVHRAGLVTAESSVVERAAQANRPHVLTPLGVLGRSISVGIMSDSFDVAPGVPRASVGVGEGDLPGPGNPDGYTDPVEVFLEGSSDPSANNIDEGRGMAEIVHDIAPAARICFATCGQTQTEMVSGILELQAEQCDILVDDIYFLDEPFFSDGEISQAMDHAAMDDNPAYKKLAFFSAAGNSGNLGYSSSLRPLTAAQAVAAQGPAHLSLTPAVYYQGGVHNFGSAAHPVVAMPMQTGDTDTGPTIVFQWDDPFDAGAVTTDYNLLVFDASGNFLSTISGIDNNFATDEPIEIADLEPNTSYYLVIALASHPSPAAKHLQFISADGTPISSPYISYTASTIVGHPVAASVAAVGAYVYNSGPDRTLTYNPAATNPPPGVFRPVLEGFTSNGGRLPIYFDAQGRRLATPLIRVKPEFSAADGVDTSFFPPGDDVDFDNDGFPNFFGTSASAPTAAGIAALMLEAAGGPGHLTSAQIRAKLQQTTFPHDLDPFYAQATAGAGSTVLKVVGHGNDSDQSSLATNFFTVTFSGTADTLDQLQIDLTNAGLAGLAFDSDPNTGLPFTRGASTSVGVSIIPAISANRRVLTLNFAHTFHAGQTVTFGIDRDYAATGYGGNSADSLAGGTVTATLGSGQKLLAAFSNHLGRGFSVADGYGLIDAQAAVESIVGKAAVVSGVPENISTRAFVGVGGEVLIGGFIIQDGPKKVVVRGIGPSLAVAGVTGALIDPTLDLYDANGIILAHNNNWRDSTAQAAEILASGLAPSNSRESALIETLPAANYTTIVRGASGRTGNALVEVYDVDQGATPARLANISSRGSVKTGDGVMIGGFIVNGTVSTTAVIRAIGPSLVDSGVSGVLSDPFLELHDGNGSLLLSNDNWQQDSNQAVQIQSSGLAPKNALESAIAITLRPGSYTAVVRGAHGETGVGLVEMYNVR